MTGSANTQMVPTQLGPALADLPGDWEIVKNGEDGIVVVRMPLDQDADPESLVNIPGYLQPNFALRFFPSPASEGGVARSAGDELRAALHSFPGSSLLASTPFDTPDGLPGRAQLLTGLQQRVPYQVSRWYVGVGDSVVEIVLTLPNTPHPDLLALGEAVAQSVRPDPSGTEASTTREHSLPAIPEKRLDVSLQNHLREEGADVSVGRLEKLNEVLADIDLAPLPGKGGRVSTSALDYLESTAELGNIGKFSAQRGPEVEQLESLGIIENGELSEAGHHTVSGVSEEPDLVISGIGAGGETRGRVWLDGHEATLLLGPSWRELQKNAEATDGFVLRELGLSVSVILDSWTANQAAWFIDYSVDCTPQELDAALIDGGFSDDVLTGTSGFASEALSHPLTLWTVDVPQTGERFQWVRTHDRGPLVVTQGENQLIQLKSTTAAVIHDSIATMVVNASRAEDG